MYISAILLFLLVINSVSSYDKCPLRCRCVGKSQNSHQYHKIYMKSWIRNLFSKNKGYTPQGNNLLQDHDKSNGRDMICLGLTDLPNIPKDITKLQIFGGKRGLKLIKQAGINEITKAGSKYGQYQIEGINKDKFKGPTKLDDLNIRGNRIKTIQNEDFKNVKHLRKLSLRQNKIEIIEVKTFKNLKKLKILDLSDNRIEELPRGIFDEATKVEVLRLRGNNLQCLPPNAFTYMPNLRIIDLSENQISDLDLNIFEFNPKLEELYLNNNKFIDIRPSWFENLQNLKKLSLEGNQLDFVPSAAIAQLVGLKSLNIKKNKISSIDAFSWDRMENLITLDLSDNRIEFIPDETFAGLSKLIQLNLDTNLINKVQKKNFKGLFNLRKLSLKMNDITHLDTGIFEELSKIQFLDLSHNILKEIKDKTFYDLHHLQEIKLDYNNISVLEDLAFSVRPNSYYSKVTWISLHHNNLTSIRRRAFSGNPHLKFLNLAYNKITEIPKYGLRSLYNLQSLMLNNNRITRLESDCFSTTRVLTHLDLANNQIKHLPKRLFRIPRQLQEIKLSGNYLDTLDQHVLKPIIHLMKIDLSRNSFEYFQFKTFHFNTKLTSVNFGKNDLRRVDFSDHKVHQLKNLDLAENGLETLDPDMVNWLRSKATVDLHGNPWFCDCNLVWISTKKTEKNLRFAHESETVCATPDHRIGFKLSEFTSCEDKPEPEIEPEEVNKVDSNNNFLFPEDLTPEPSLSSANEELENTIQNENGNDLQNNIISNNGISNRIANELPQSHSKHFGSIACKGKQFQDNTPQRNSFQEARNSYKLPRWHATVVEQSGAALCGGVRIAEKWILTHAACWNSKRFSKQQITYNEIKIKIGDQNVPGDVNGPWYYVNEVFFPPNMDTSAGKENQAIALVQLKVGRKIGNEQNVLVTYEYPCIGNPDDYNLFYMTTRAAYLLDFTQVRVHAVQVNPVSYLERKSPDCRTESYFCVRKSMSQFSTKYYDTASSPIYGKPDLALLGIKSEEYGTTTQKFLDLNPMINWIDQTMNRY